MTTDLPVDPDFTRNVEQCEVDAWLSLDASHPDARELTFHTIDGATLILDRATVWPHSRILNLGVNRPATSETIEKLLDATKAAGISSLSTEVSPIARPGTLSRLLSQAGFVPVDRSVVVARSTSAMDQPDDYFRIRTATIADAAEMVSLMSEVMPGAPDWYALLANQVSQPAWQYFVALEDSVFCAITAIHTSGEIAWLSPVWVREAFRNRGTQAALIAHAVREAGRHGAQWVVASYPATVPGRTRNFERLGFSIVYLRTRYIWKSDGN